MLHGIESVQLFLIIHPEPNQELLELVLINFALIQLVSMKTDIYTKLTY